MAHTTDGAYKYVQGRSRMSPGEGKGGEETHIQSYTARLKLNHEEERNRWSTIQRCQSDGCTVSENALTCQKHLKETQGRLMKQHHYLVVPIGLTVEAIHDPIPPVIYVANTIGTNNTTFGTTNE